MSDEEDDYMSDKFLTGIPDVRPSLVHNRGKKREFQMELKHKDHIKKQKETRANTSAVVNNDKLQEALSKPIESENKGFKLLAKMGYKPGQTLGKTTAETDSSVGTRQQQQQQRLLEPIGITIKSDRQGLGRETALKELEEKRLQIRMERVKNYMGSEKTTIEEFRKRTTQKAEEKFVENAIRLCQKTCENLDLESQIESPAMLWFWPEKPKEDTGDTDSDNEEQFEEVNDDDDEVEVEVEEFNNVEKLEMLTSYVRTSYNFCYWCGVHYENVQDLLDNCPGLTKDDH